MKYLNFLLINKEARLFDSKEFLMKTFVAVLIGYIIGTEVTFISRDMISLLFGMMLTIEPTNLTGIQSGIRQIEATVIGAMITGVILAVFGYNPWTAAFAVTATLYVSLVIDWRSYSVVAVFTSIYMTQYVQLDRFGQPSEVETFKLRMAALLTGIIVAFLVNWVFSVLGYGHMLEKRVYHLLDKLHQRMMSIHLILENKAFGDATLIMTAFQESFNDTEWIIGTLKDYKKDPFVKRGEIKTRRLDKIIAMTDLIREMNHINYDMCYKMTKGNSQEWNEAFIACYEHAVKDLSRLNARLDLIIRNRSGKYLYDAEERCPQDSLLQILNEDLISLNRLLDGY